MAQPHGACAIFTSCVLKPEAKHCNLPWWFVTVFHCHFLILHFVGAVPSILAPFHSRTAPSTTNLAYFRLLYSAGQCAGSCGNQPFRQKTRWQSPKTVVKRKFEFSSGQPSRQKRAVDRPKLQWNANLSLPSRNHFVKNVLSILQNCSEPSFFPLHAAKHVSRCSSDSYVFAHCTVAKRTFPHFGMHAAVARRTFSFCWMNPLAGCGGSVKLNSKVLGIVPRNVLDVSMLAKWRHEGRSYTLCYASPSGLRAVYWTFQCSRNGALSVAVALWFKRQKHTAALEIFGTLLVADGLPAVSFLPPAHSKGQWHSGQCVSILNSDSGRRRRSWWN